MSKKPALGRGLSALLPDGASFDPEPGERVRHIERERIAPNPFQPRRAFDEEKLAELAESIKTYGVMQPLILSQRGEGFVIVAGERRFRAAALAGLDSVPAVVRELDDQQLAELSLIENIQREDLAPLEEAAACQALIESHGYTQEALAARLGKSRPYIANTLRLLKLTPQDKRLLEQGLISAGHARALLSLSDARQRAILSAAMLRDHLSVRQAEELAARLKSGRSAAPTPRTQKSLLHADIAQELSARLGVRAAITGQGGKGRVTLEFTSEDDLQNIIDAILG